jgi:hypothetical protein
LYRNKGQTFRIAKHSQAFITDRVQDFPYRLSQTCFARHGFHLRFCLPRQEHWVCNLLNLVMIKA